MLASEKEQRIYAENVPHVDITRELVAGWFDDSYHPESAAFAAWFSPAELQVLQSFDAEFAKVHAVLPPSNGSVDVWLATGPWRNLMEHAALARRHIEG